MKKAFTLTFLASLLLAFASCEKNNNCVVGNDQHADRTFNLPPIQRIELAESANVTIRYGTEQNITVNGPSNIIDILNTNVNGNRWIIDFGEHCAEDYYLNIYITIPVIEEVDLSGAGDIHVLDMISTENFDMSISGSGNIRLNQLIGLERLRASISGSGNIIGSETNANVQNLDVFISGSGNFQGFDFMFHNTDVNISGSGNVETFTHDYLNVRISGSGNVIYKGYPSTNTNITGSGGLVNAN